MEGTVAPIPFSSMLRGWLGQQKQGRAWLATSSSRALLDRVHRAYVDGRHTAGLGSSFLAEWLWAGREESAAAVEGMVLVGQLRPGRAGADDAPRLPAPIGFRDVRVDRRGSRVGNPFKAGDSTQACLAYDLLMTLALMHACTEDTTLLAAGVDGAMPRAVAGTMERALLQSISSLVPVQLAHTAHTFSVAGLMAWLYAYARLVAGGQRLRLLCWCCDDGSCAQPGSSPCHARSLAVILMWMACHLNKGSPSEQRLDASEVTSYEPPVQVHTRLHPILGADSHPSLSMLDYYRSGVATSDQTSPNGGCPTPQCTDPRPGRLISNASHDGAASSAHMHSYVARSRRPARAGAHMRLPE